MPKGHHHQIYTYLFAIPLTYALYGVSHIFDKYILGYIYVHKYIYICVYVMFSFVDYVFSRVVSSSLSSTITRKIFSSTWLIKCFYQTLKGYIYAYTQHKLIYVYMYICGYAYYILIWVWSMFIYVVEQVGAPPEMASVLEEINRDSQYHYPISSSCSNIELGADPELDQFMVRLVLSTPDSLPLQNSIFSF